MSPMRWLLISMLLLAAGCARQPDSPKILSTASVPAIPQAAPIAPAPAVSAVKPYVMHLPGVSGTSIVDYTLREGMRAAGFDGPVEIYDWTCHDPGIPALHARMRNEEQAQIVADILTRQYRDHPEQRIYVTSHSGGAGPATWALERLPADVKVHCFVMLAPALSPTYDLSQALSHVSGNAYCFHSPDDDLVLGTGTKLFGTIDGVRCEAAGKNGFEKPPTADPAQYSKLIQQPYQLAWSRYGYIGGHIGCMGTPFVEAIVAPLMLGRAAAAKALERAATQPLPDILWPK
jgi:hypothetical protein